MLFKSLPQESVLNPMLFNLYIKDILKVILYNCKTIQFADDIVILCQDKNKAKIWNSLMEAFNKINYYLLTWSFPSKTQLFLIMLWVP